MKSSRPGSRGARCACVALAVLGLILLSSRTAWAIDEALLGALKRVQKVRIEGNSAIGDGAIKKVIKTGAGSFLGLRSLPLYRPDFLRSDAETIQNLYARRGYLDATVAARADSGDQPGRVIVTFNIVEGPQVRVASVDFDTTGVLSLADTRSAIHLKAGQPYDPVQVALDRQSLAERFADEGYFPTITSEARRDSTREFIHFEIVSGPAYHVREISILGVQAVDTSAVRRELLLRPGDRFRRQRLTKSSERLYEAGLFNSVEIEPVRVDTLLGSVDLRVRVRERKPRWVDGGIGAGSLERARLSAEWGNRNLAGSGQALTTSASFGFYQRTRRSMAGTDSIPTLYRFRGALAYTEPWLLGRRIRGQISPSFEHGFEILSKGTYIQEAWVLSIGLARDFTTSKSRLSLVLNNIWTTKAEVFGDTTRFFIPPYMRRLTLAYDRDSRDNPLDPRSGALAHASAQLSGAVVGGQGRYMKLDGSEGIHVRNGTNGSFGVRLRAGWITAVGPGPSGDAGIAARVPPTDRFRIGGGSSVRGYHENGIDDGGDGGRFLLNTNLEWRFPIKGIVSGAAFVDGGNVWHRLSDIKLERLIRPTGVSGTYGAADMRWSIGPGLRVRTPIGPVRFDYGFRFHIDEVDLLAPRKPERGGWHFSIGQLF